MFVTGGRKERNDNIDLIEPPAQGCNDRFCLFKFAEGGGMEPDAFLSPELSDVLFNPVEQIRSAADSPANLAVEEGAAMEHRPENRNDNPVVNCEPEKFHGIR